MAWTLTDDVDAYGAAVGELLRSQPERYTVLLSVLASLTRLGPAAFGQTAPLLGWWSQDGAVRAAVLQTPPHPMLLTDLPGPSAGQLARALDGRGSVLAAVNGAQPDAEALGRAWCDLTGLRGRVHQRQRLFRLGKLVAPDPAPEGSARVAVTADAAIVRSWTAAFAAEVGQVGSPESVVSDRLARGQLMLWETAGEPVSIAGVTDTTAGVARVGPVYTPPALRGRGYGAGVTAAISELAAARGVSSVILFTDLANPVSNSLYAKLGYEPVEDRVLLAFEA